MECTTCGSELVAFTVPADLREFVPENQDQVGLCRRCLSVEPVDDAPEDLPDFTSVSDTFPENREVAAALALAVGLLSSLAIHRESVEALFERVERAGVDPLLVLNRLAADPGLDPAVDLDRRLDQLSQLRD